MCFWRPWGTIIHSQELVPKDAKWSSLPFSSPDPASFHQEALHLPCTPPASPETDSPPRQHLPGATRHISDTTELPRCQIWAKFCAGVGKPSPTFPWATHCYLLPQSKQSPRLIFLKFTLEYRSLCLQSLQWLPKTCIMKIKPLASLYDSHSESDRDSPRTHPLFLGTPKGLPRDSQSPGTILIPRDSSCPSASDVTPHQTHLPDKYSLL